MIKSIFNKHTSVKHIIQNAVEGWEKGYTKRDIYTFGSNRNSTECYGCLATNALCNLSDKKFNHKVIYGRTNRATHLGEQYNLNSFSRYECAIDCLREGDYEKFLNNLSFVENLGFKLNIDREQTIFNNYGKSWKIMTNSINDKEFIKLKNFLNYLNNL